MSSNRAAEKPTLKYSCSHPCFHNNSWYLVKMRPSTSAGEVSPCLTGQIHVKSIVSEFKDSGSEGVISAGVWRICRRFLKFAYVDVCVCIWGRSTHFV